MWIAVVSVVMSFTNTGYKMDGVVHMNNLDTDTEMVIGMTAPNGAADTSEFASWSPQARSFSTWNY